MSTLLGRDFRGADENPGHPVDHACWHCATPELLDAAARGQLPLPRPLHLNVAWQHCPHLTSQPDE